ncbi:MAG: HIT family protein [Planctomycetes bacterium]|nr:HIT family protein [Planctomycetota bacterium]
MPTVPPLSDPACIFCKIIAGQIPCHRLYEDGQVLAFLDIGPLSRGHTLVIPKAHHATLDQMSDALASACAAVLPRLSRALIAATGVEAWNILQNNGATAGQVVPHVHFHIIPRTRGDGLGYRWPAGKLDPNDAASLVESIKRSL